MKYIPLFTSKNHNSFRNFNLNVFSFLFLNVYELNNATTYLYRQYRMNAYL